jgi:hypothetical protein
VWCRRLLIALVLAHTACVPPGETDLLRAVPPLAKPGDETPPQLRANRGFQRISYDLWWLGRRLPGDRITVTIRSLETCDMFLLDATGAILDAAHSIGGIDYVAVQEDNYYLFLHMSQSFYMPGLMSLTIEPGQPIPSPRPQVFAVDFACVEPVRLPESDELTQLSPMDLSAMGQTIEEQASLAEIQPAVERLIAERLNAIFRPYGMTVMRVTPNEPITDEHSTVHFTNDPGGPSDSPFDTTLIQQDGVEIYVAYGVAEWDPGNRIPDDDAVVFVGSYLDQSGLLVSTNDLVNILAHSAAHEMGHLVGLMHVFRRSDIMWGEPNVAFTRQLDLGRGQVMFGGWRSEDLYAIPFIYQDPDKYLGHTLLLP